MLNRAILARYMVVITMLLLALEIEPIEFPFKDPTMRSRIVRALLLVTELHRRRFLQPAANAFYISL